MQVSVTALPKSSAELHVEFAPDELRPYLDRAAEALSREHPLPGFRPGKVPYTVAANRYGEQALYEEAADHAVRDAYVRAVREHHLNTIGHPKIELTTVAPGNPLRFTATVSVLPEVILPDLATITIERRSVQVPPADIDRALEDLRKLRPKEMLVDRPVEASDKVVIDLDLTRQSSPGGNLGGLTHDRVAIEGGQARGHEIYLTESYYLPKVKEELVGMRKGETKSFPLSFPADHYQKRLAGTTVDCAITVKGVYGVELPTLDDAFAASLGQSNLAALRGLITRNLTEEAAKKASDAEEITMIDAVIAKSRISELPELLITGEAHRMVDELERGVARQGLAFDEYLKTITKTRDQLFLEFAPEAVRRVKAALVTRAAAEEANVAVNDADVDTEVQQQLDRYADTPEFHQRMQSEEARDYIRMTLRNRKVIEWMRSKVQWG